MAENQKTGPPMVPSESEKKVPLGNQTETYLVSPERGAATSLSNRLGWSFVILLIGSSVFSVACMGWFAFLWWGTVENSVWHSIVINDWAVRAISLPSSAFRMAIAIQAGACLSMLAAIAIEKSYIPLPNIASISIMRATSPSTSDGVFKFIYPLIRSPGNRPLGLLSIAILAIFILLTSSILSFTSTILLSDVTVQPIPDSEIYTIVQLDHFWGPVQETIDYYPNGFMSSYHVDLSNSYWQGLIPSVLANFAEASEEPELVPGLIDTGPTLRAFLPLAISEDRGRLRSYRGQTVVWDARVVCQEPKITNLKLHLNGTTIIAISGEVQNSVTADIIQEPEPNSIKFFCPIPYIPLLLWSPPIICQLPNADITTYSLGPPVKNYGGGLKSQFGLPDRKKRTGGAYLVLNRTVLTIPEETEYLNENPGWIRIQRIPDSLVQSRNINVANGTILGTLCYTPLDAVDRNVTISRIRPVPESPFSNYRLYEQYDPRSISNIGRYLYDDILPKLVPGVPRKTPEERGFFSLEPVDPSWAAAETDVAYTSDGPWGNQNSTVTLPGQVHFLMNELHLKAGIYGTNDVFIYGNYSLLPDDQNFKGQQATYNTLEYAIIGKTWQANLYTAVKDHPDGNSAFALQALLTAIASTAYYDQLQRLERLGSTYLNSFRNVSSPGGPFGTRRGGTYAIQQGGLFATYVKGQVPVGYTVVVVVLAAHLIIVAIILIRFIKETTFTRIGDPWQALAQVATQDVAAVGTALQIGRQVESRRDAVDKELENLGQHVTRVGVEQQLSGSTRLNQRGGQV
ncbi:Mitochondrial outer membrane protein iml2 [Orbilia ellipsospora]|uniref:Mitochondrial outer membrane protein iml2 n=1 Tax=Orbilia ellipsospora TaxID=2528407 RepID=A0AAV9XNC9_9PEZI